MELGLLRMGGVAYERREKRLGEGGGGVGFLVGGEVKRGRWG